MSNKAQKNLFQTSFDSFSGFRADPAPACGHLALHFAPDIDLILIFWSACGSNK